MQFPSSTKLIYSLVTKKQTQKHTKRWLKTSIIKWKSVLNSIWMRPWYTLIRGTNSTSNSSLRSNRKSKNCSCSKRNKRITKEIFSRNCKHWSRKDRTGRMKSCLSIRLPTILVKLSRLMLVVPWNKFPRPFSHQYQVLCLKRHFLASINLRNLRSTSFCTETQGFSRWY